MLSTDPRPYATIATQVNEYNPDSGDEAEKAPLVNKGTNSATPETDGTKQTVCQTLTQTGKAYIIETAKQVAINGGLAAAGALCFGNPLGIGTVIGISAGGAAVKMAVKGMGQFFGCKQGELGACGQTVCAMATAAGNALLLSNGVEGAEICYRVGAAAGGTIGGYIAHGASDWTLSKCGVERDSAFRAVVNNGAAFAGGLAGGAATYYGTKALAEATGAFVSPDPDDLEARQVPGGGSGENPDAKVPDPEPTGTPEPTEPCDKLKWDEDVQQWVHEGDHDAVEAGLRGTKDNECLPLKKENGEYRVPRHNPEHDPNVERVKCDSGREGIRVNNPANSDRVDASSPQTVKDHIHKQMGSEAPGSREQRTGLLDYCQPAPEDVLKECKAEPTLPPFSGDSSGSGMKPDPTPPEPTPPENTPPEPTSKGVEPSICVLKDDTPSWVTPVATIGGAAAGGLTTGGLVACKGAVQGCNDKKEQQRDLEAQMHPATPRGMTPIDNRTYQAEPNAGYEMPNFADSLQSDIDASADSHRGFDDSHYEMTPDPDRPRISAHRRPPLERMHTVSDPVQYNGAAEDVDGAMADLDEIPSEERIYEPIKDRTGMAEGFDPYMDMASVSGHGSQSTVNTSHYHVPRPTREKSDSAPAAYSNLPQAAPQHMQHFNPNSHYQNAGKITHV